MVLDGEIEIVEIENEGEKEFEQLRLADDSILFWDKDNQLWVRTSIPTDEADPIMMPSNIVKAMISDDWHEYVDRRTKIGDK